MERLTIKKIAELAGVSPSAVSIVINNGKGVSQKTREKVQKIIEANKYTPNPSARRLLFNKTNNVAVLFKRNVSPLDHSFYSKLNSVILRECEKNELNMVLASYTVSDNRVQLPNVLITRDVDGAILYSDVEKPVLEAIDDLGLPYIVVDNSLEYKYRLSVTADYVAAARIATDHLIELGHTKIAYLGDRQLPYFNTHVFEGFRLSMAEKNLAVPLGWILHISPDGDSIGNCIDSLLSSQELPTAIMCCADIYAIQVIRELKKRQIRIPKDMSVIGIDNILIGEYVSPALSTVEIDTLQMGQKAISLLLESIKSADVLSMVVKSGRLIQRESTAPPAT